jgi:hypothetical protein
LLLLGGGGGIPLGIPPLPEDPVLAKVAPEECLVYVASVGMAKPDPRSTNQTEQLFAEPEMRHLVAEVERLIRTQLAAKELDGPGKVLAKEGPTLVKALLTRPLALYAAQVKLVPGGPPEVRSGAVVNLGEGSEEFTTALTRCLKLLPGDRVKEVTVAGASFHQVALGPGAPSLTWGIKDKYLFAALGEGEMEALLKRVDGTAPGWLTSLRKRLPVPRVSTVGMINVEGLMRVLGPLAGPEVARVLQATGLDGIERLEGVSGLDKDGFVSRSLFAVKGEPRALLRLGEGLTPADLAIVPRDATFAAAVGLDPAKTFNVVREVIEKIDPRAAEQLRRALAMIEEETGIAPVKDLLEPLGHTFCLFDSPGGGGLFTGVTAVVSLKDAKAAAATQDKLLRLLDKVNERADPRQRPKVEKLTFGRSTIHVLAVPERGFPLAPAWCVTDRHLVVALFPEAIKAFLSRNETFQPLTTLPEVRSALAEEGQTIGLLYVNAQRLFDLSYPLMGMVANSFSAQMRHEGIDVPPGLLPSAGSIRRHLRPSVTTKRRTAAGIEVVSRQTLPGSVSLSTAPLSAGLLVPGVQKVREAAGRTKSMNNLKQIALAMHNYHDVNRAFPPAYVPSKDGKAQLSWRVLILPYIEQDALYKEFKLDEPWDSEHNKKLIERMPAIYRSPASQAAAGQTTYLTVRGRDTAFPGTRGIKFTDITDGTSNTIMVVEASDKKAVPWTKPDDFERNEKDPKAGLMGAWPGGFLAALCDGSVRLIRESVDPKVLLNLFDRNDGNVIEAGDL